MLVSLHKCGTGGIAKASPYDPSPKHGLHGVPCIGTVHRLSVLVSEEARKMCDGTEPCEVKYRMHSFTI